MARKETAEDKQRRLEYIEQVRGYIETAGGEVTTYLTRMTEGGTSFLKVFVPVEIISHGRTRWTVEDITGRVGHIIGRPWNRKTGEIKWADYGSVAGAILAMELSRALYDGDEQRLEHNRLF